MYFEPIGKHTSIFQAEIDVIDTCDSFNLRRRYREQNIAILTESHKLNTSRYISILALKVNKAADKQEPTCRIGKEFMAMTLRNEDLYWASLIGAQTLTKLFKPL